MKINDESEENPITYFDFSTKPRLHIVTGGERCKFGGKTE